MMTIWCWSNDGMQERWIGASTRAEAIADASAEGKPFDLAEAREVCPLEIFPSAQRFIEDAAEHALDEYGAEDWPSLTIEQGKRFAAEYEALLKKYFPGPCPFSDLLTGREHIDPRTTSAKNDG